MEKLKPSEWPDLLDDVSWQVRARTALWYPPPPYRYILCERCIRDSNIILISVHAQWNYIQLQYFGCLFQRTIERHNALAHWNIPWRMRKGRRNTYTFRRPPTSSLGWSSEEHKQIDMNSSSHFFAFTPLSMDKLSAKLHFLAVSLKPVLWSVINWRLPLV